MSGAGGTAYTLVYTAEAEAPITPDTVNDAYAKEGWKHYSMQLGNEAATFAEVPGLEPAIPYSDGETLTMNGASVPVITSVAEGFAETTVYDASDPSAWKRLATVPNYIYGIHDLP